MAAILNFTSLSISSLAFSILILSSTLCLIEAQTTGFSVELIHRDSPKSPFYNPMETTSARATNAVRRSFALASRFISTSNSTQGVEYSNVTVGFLEYLMKLSIGTPPVDFFGIVATATDEVWTQCKPSAHCFEQKAPLFDPSQSSTYNLIPCNASQCRRYDGHTCSSNETCQYFAFYGEKTYSGGDIAFDTITFASTTGPPVSFPNMVIGCGHNNDFKFKGEVSDQTGIVGLGGGEFSLISQMGPSIAGKFSHCFVPMDSNKSSRMNFGSNAIVSGSGVVSTPLIKLDSSPTFY